MLDPSDSPHIPDQSCPKKESPCHYTRVRPSCPIQEIDTILYAIEHGRAADLAPSILAIAALLRSLADKETAPRLLVVRENVITNALTSSSEMLPKISLDGRKLLYLNIHALARSNFEELKIQLEERCASFNAAMLVAEIPRSRRQEKEEPLLIGIAPLVSNHDEITAMLLSETEHALTTKDPTPLVQKLTAALQTLRTTSFSFRHTAREFEFEPTVVALITELAETGTLGTAGTKLLERHEVARQMSLNMWAHASHPQDGVYILPHLPYAEVDEMSASLLRELYENSKEAKVVLQYAPDRSATKLSYSEGLEFERRLHAGESPEDILKEMEVIFKAREDQSSLLDLALHEDRDREPLSFVEQQIEYAKYRADPLGKYTVLKAPDEIMTAEFFQTHGISMITHHALYSIDFQKGTSRIMNVEFQAKDLTVFLEAI